MRLFVGACVFANAMLLAMPSSPTVISGSGTFQTNADKLTISLSSDRSIIEWDSFSLGSGDIVLFNQPNSTSACLSRITGSAQSFINGKLSSNGGVYIINPQGVVIGPQGCVDTSSFLASTLDVSNSEFLAGSDMTFSGSSLEEVRNDGVITTVGDDAVLIGYRVINRGEISSTSTVALAAGKEVVYKPLDSERIFIAAAVDSPSGTGVDIQGKVHGNQAILKADGNIYALAINVTGYVEAVGTNSQDGNILLYSEDGTVRVEDHGFLNYVAKDAGSATVKVLGKHIELLDESYISSRCETGGGKIYIGGGVSGLDPEILNASTTTVTGGVRIDSSPQQIGNAGDVVIYSDDYTKYEGIVYARGGITAGNGGTVEVSGKVVLVMSGVADTLAINGQTGLLVIDPNNITISTAADTIGTACPTFSGGPATANLSTTTLRACLLVSNVLVTTSPGAGGSGDITIDSGPFIPFTSPGNDLTFFADRDILHSSGFFLFSDTVGTANVSFIAGRNLTFASTSLFIATGCASLNYIAGNSVIGGSLLISGTAASVDTPINNYTASTAGADITIESTGIGIITNGTAISVATTLTAGRDIILGNSCVNTGTGSFSLTSGRDLIVGQSASNARLGVLVGDVTATVGRDLIVEGGTGTNDFAQIGANLSTGVDSNLIFSVGGDVTVSAGVSPGTGNYAMIGHGGLSTVGGIFSGNIVFNSIGGDVTIMGGTLTDRFAQIGHRRGGAGAVTVTGNIQGSGPNGVVDIPGDLLVQAGPGTGSYALFGHGGEGAALSDTFTGNVGVRATNITVQGATASFVDAIAGIGYYARNTGGTFTILSPSTIRVISTNDMTAQADFGNAYIGTRIITSGAGSAAVSMPLVDIQSGNDLSLLGQNPHTGSDEVLCGVFVDSGTAESNLSITVANDFVQNTFSGGAGISPFTRVTNGIGTVDGYTQTITVGGNASLLAGNGIAIIEAIDTLIMSVGGDFTITPSSDASASILSKDSMNVTVGGLLALNGDSALLQAIIQNTTGTLSVSGGAIFTDTVGGIIENLGTGSSSVSATSSDLTLQNGAVITVGSDLAVSAARDVILVGALASSILTTSGDLSVIADRDISVGASTLIRNLGSGDLTLVVDNQAPTIPEIGDGSFILRNGGMVGRVGGGLLRIFTARRGQNTIRGSVNINGATFVPGGFGKNSPTEIWTTYFSSTLGGTPFTIFYKEPIAGLPIANFELFYMFDKYYPYRAWLWRACIFDGSGAGGPTPPETDKVPYVDDIDPDGGCLALPRRKYI